MSRAWRQEYNTDVENLRALLRLVPETRDCKSIRDAEGYLTNYSPRGIQHDRETVSFGAKLIYHFADRTTDERSAVKTAAAKFLLRWGYMPNFKHSFRDELRSEAAR